ncbi:response regulator transcription factor [Paenibacillus dakarensis]|uniref:response regulator transcription factor n=1 Tax=Paenibacillus dakarensis TaxID=1527293 RepID=UPI0006D57FA1|nr:response regulator [Paenibacillus dakarensis]
MYNILIVDDEPKIVNLLYDQLLDWSPVEMEVYRAYSAQEAAQIIEKTKFHIALMDIHMPGMTGLELQQRMVQLWPRCRVIFLTAYNDFDYVQSALRHGAVDFILKIENDDAILASLNKALASLKKDTVVEQYMVKAEQKFKAARPMLQKEYLWSLLQGELPPGQLGPERFQDLQLPFDSDERVLLVAARVDHWRELIKPSDKPLLIYGIDNIAAEFLNPVRSAFCADGNQHLVWFIQPSTKAESLSDWKSCLTYVMGTMSDIQEACEGLLKLPVSVAVSHDACSWMDTPVQYLKLQQMLWRGLGLGREMIVQDSPVSGKGPCGSREEAIRQELVLQLRKLKRLQDHLESGEQEDFLDIYREISEFAQRLAKQPEYYTSLLEIQYGLISLYLSYINQSELMEETAGKISLDPLLGKKMFRSWEEAEVYFSRLAAQLFSLRGSDQKNRTGWILSTLHQYIETHFNGDVSLDYLADLVGLHPAYLSRLYKQATGYRLSDYIKEIRIHKAKELLADPRLRVHEVATRVGFETSYYFSKVFKKEMNLTPQEYRERCAKRSIVDSSP